MQNDKVLEQEDKFYEKLMSKLENNEKKIDSEIKRKITIDNKEFNLVKIKGTNTISVSSETRNTYDYFLGKTIFKDKNEEFVPISFQQISYYLKNRKGKYIYLLDSNIIDENTIRLICYQGEGKTITLKYSPFNIELNEKIFNLKKLKKEYNELTLEDLSIFYIEYFPYLEKNITDFQFICSNERKTFFEEITKKLYSPEQVIELFGPFGIGKSTSLLAYQKSEIEMRSAYYNLNAIYRIKDDNNKMIQLILYESMTLCDTFGEFEGLKNYIQKNNNNTDYWDVLKKIIKYISENFHNKYLIMFDQYKEKFKESKVKIAEKLEDILFNNFTIKVMKCSSMDDTEVKEKFIKILNRTNCIYIDKLIEITTSNEKEKLYFGNIYLFHYLYIISNKNFLDFIEEQKKIIKKDIRSIIPNSTGLLKSISHITNIMKNSLSFDENELKSLIILLPVKYLSIKEIIKSEQKTKSYTFEYSCFLIRIIFEELVVEELKNLKDTPGLNDLKGLLGGIFEILCHFAILSNKLEIFNLNSKKLFYINKNLYNKKENQKNWKLEDGDSKKIKALDSVYIRPTNTNSELYDSVIIFKEKDEDNNSAYLLQMSISKDKGKDIETRDNHLIAIDKVKEKINKIYDIKIDNVYFSYIFNYDDIHPEDIIECSRQKLDYFYYSMERDNFYQIKFDLKINKSEKSKLTNTEKDVIRQNELINSVIMKTLDLNVLSKMTKTKLNLELIKPPNVYEKDKFYAAIFLGRKTCIENKNNKGSNIIDNLSSFKYIIDRKKSLLFEYYKEKARVNIILYNLYKNYLLILKDINSKIYCITNGNSYEYINQKWEMKDNNLGERIFFKEELFDVEIFSIV